MAGNTAKDEKKDMDDLDVAHDRNPSPPSELFENAEAMADIIPGTVVSKQWVLYTLYTTLQNIESDLPSHSKGKYEDFMELDETIEEEMCKLWDLSGDSAVSQFLMEMESFETLQLIISKSKAPRLTEISMGILANLACNFEYCEIISDDSLIKNVFVLLDYPDSPTLFQTIRLFNICLITPTTSSNWLTAVKSESDGILSKLCFILESTTNCDLLKVMADLLDNILDLDDGISQVWSGRELIAGIIEAMKQIKNFYPETRDTYFHVLQVISVVENGARGIRHYGDPLFKLLKEYLREICEDDFLCINGRHCGLASTVALLIIVCSEEETNILKNDSHIFSYLLRLFSLCSNSSTEIVTSHSPILDNNSDSNLNKILKEALIAFWCHVIQGLSLPNFVIEELEKASTKDLKILLNELRKISTENFDYVGYLHSRTDGGNYNKLRELLKDEAESNHQN